MISMTPHRTRRPRCCRTCLKPMQGHPTGKNNPCRPVPNILFQPSPTKPWPRTNQVIGRMMDSFRIKENEDVDADNELDDFDTSYECPSASSSSSDESATSTFTLVNPNKRRLVPRTPSPPSKRAATPFPRSRRSPSTDIDIELVPPALHSSDRSFFLDSPFHHTSYPPNPILPEPSFVIPDTGDWNRVNPNHRRPTNNAQLPLTSASSLRREGSAHPTEFVPSPVRVPALRTRRTGSPVVVRDVPGLQMLQLPPSHPEKFWGTECPTERAGSESRVSTPTPAPEPSMPVALSTARSKLSVATTSKKPYLEVPPRMLSHFGSVPPKEQEENARRSTHDDDGGCDERALVVLTTALVPTSGLPPVSPVRTRPPSERSFESGFALASREIIEALLQEFLGGLSTWTGFKVAAFYFFIPLFVIFFMADLAADWVKANWLS